MAAKDLSIEVRTTIIDAWLHDPVDRGTKPMQYYVLVEIQVGKQAPELMLLSEDM